MKRMICLTLTILFLFLTSCEESSSQNIPSETAGLTAELIEKKIAKLSNPSYDEGNNTFITVLEDLEKGYAGLSEEQKREVKNYDRLLLAREIYNFDWIKKHAKQKIRAKVIENSSDPCLLQLKFDHIYLYKFEEKIYVLAILDYMFPNETGNYKENSETGYYLFLPNQNGLGYDLGTELDADTYQKEVTETTYYRRPQWK